MQLIVAELEIARVVAEARARLPAEACGLLVGRVLVDGACEVVRAESARNATLEPAEDRYEVHPEDFLAIDRAARRDGLAVVGVWHSHPDSAARPSRTDVERAWPGWSYLIVGRAAHADVHVRSWRIDEDGAVFEEAVLDEAVHQEHVREQHFIQIQPGASALVVRNHSQGSIAS